MSTKKKGLALVEVLITLFVLELLFMGFINYLNTKKDALKQDLQKMMLTHKCEVMLEKYIYSDGSQKEYHVKGGEYSMTFTFDEFKTKRGLITIYLEGRINGGRMKYTMRRDVFEKSSYID